MLSTTISTELLIALIPVILLEFSLLLYALYDWIKQGPSLENRFIWLILILGISVVGPVIYFLIAPRDSIDI